MVSGAWVSADAQSLYQQGPDMSPGCGHKPMGSTSGTEAGCSLESKFRATWSLQMSASHGDIYITRCWSQSGILYTIVQINLNVLKGRRHCCSDTDRGPGH